MTMKSEKTTSSRSGGPWTPTPPPGLEALVAEGKLHLPTRPRRPMGEPPKLSTSPQMTSAALLKLDRGD
jgi:hypothetical protein